MVLSNDEGRQRRQQPLEALHRELDDMAKDAQRRILESVRGPGRAGAHSRVGSRRIMDDDLKRRISVVTAMIRRVEVDDIIKFSKESMDHYSYGRRAASYSVTFLNELRNEAWNVRLEMPKEERDKLLVFMAQASISIAQRVEGYVMQPVFYNKIMNSILSTNLAIGDAQRMRAFAAYHYVELEDYDAVRKVLLDGYEKYVSAGFLNAADVLIKKAKENIGEVLEESNDEGTRTIGLSVVDEERPTDPDAPRSRGYL